MGYNVIRLSVARISKDVQKLVDYYARRLRIAAGSSHEVAIKMGVVGAYVSGLELGQRNATIVSVWHLSQALGIEVGDLFEDEKKHKKAR